MYYAVFLPLTSHDPSNLPDGETATPDKSELIYDDIREARKALKKYEGARMKGFSNRERALAFLENPDSEDSFLELETSQLDLSASFERLSFRDSPMKSPRNLNSSSQNSTSTPTKLETPEKKEEGEVESFPAAQPATLNKLRRMIESGNYEEVEETIWSNPRCLVTVCDSAIYLMAGPKYNACHIAARANKPDIVALLLLTITNPKFLRKLYPDEPDDNVQERINHLLDSYLNTPDPRQGNTPLHFACKMGFHHVVKILLTFEGCDLSLRDSSGLTAEESICSRLESFDSAQRDKMKNLFKTQLHLPIYRDQLKKRLLMAKRRSELT